MLSTAKPRNSGFEQTEYSYLPMSKLLLLPIWKLKEMNKETKPKFANVRFFNTVKPRNNSYCLFRK